MRLHSDELPSQSAWPKRCSIEQVLPRSLHAQRVFREVAHFPGRGL